MPTSKAYNVRGLVAFVSLYCKQFDSLEIKEI